MQHTIFPPEEEQRRMFQEPADLIRDSNPELNQLFPAGQNESLLMAFNAFDMYRLVPSCGMNMTGMDTVNVQARTLE